MQASEVGWFGHVNFNGDCHFHTSMELGQLWRGWDGEGWGRGGGGELLWGRYRRANHGVH